MSEDKKLTMKCSHCGNSDIKSEPKIDREDRPFIFGLPWICEKCQAKGVVWGLELIEE